MASDMDSEIISGLRSDHVRAIASAGGGFPGAEAYYTNYNQLHRVDYFDPHVTGNLHIFMTRPSLYLTRLNLSLDNTFTTACGTEEGCMLLAALTAPNDGSLDVFGDVDKDAFWTEAYEEDDSGNAISKNSDVRKFKDYKGEIAGFSAFSRLQQGIQKIGSTPFIPIVSNLSTSISGIKDLSMEVFEYDGDQAGHKTADAMGMDESQSDGELTISYLENSNLGITMMHYLWSLYIDNTGKGIMTPSLETIEDCIYDYMSSVYWFVTGPDGYSIKLYGKLTGVFPTSSPLTSLIPNERGSATDPKITINYHFNHSEIMRPEIIYDFNSIIDKANSGFINDRPRAFNQLQDSWLRQVYDKIDTGRNVNNKNYRKFYGIDNNKSGITYAIYQPSVQNAWMGHPYVISGKLVYRSLNHNIKPMELTHEAVAPAQVLTPDSDELFFGSI